MAVVIIRGHLGSGDSEIGRLIAERLDADYVDGVITEKVARLLGRGRQDMEAKELPPRGLLRRLEASLGHVPPMVLDSGVACIAYARVWETPLDDSRYLAALKSVVRELAMRESVVIHERGSQFILKHWPGSLHVMVTAPLKLRVRRLMEEAPKDQRSAAKEIERFDGCRRQFVKKYFKADREDPQHYHLVINTGSISVPEAASIVIDAVLSVNIERIRT
jgi:cytidylate kinase